jgi:hypothetical protein
MATVAEVLQMLRPGAGFVVIDNDLSTVVYDEGVKPVTQKEFDDGLANFDSVQAEKESIKIAAKTALLNKLGITAEEATLLLS